MGKTKPQFLCRLCGRAIRSFDLRTFVAGPLRGKTLQVCKGGCPAEEANRG